MPGYPECPWCPFRDDPERVCHNRVTGNRRACELIDLGRRWEARVVELTEANPVAPDSPPAPRPQPPPAITEGSAAPVPPEVSYSILKCPHRTKLPACGCQGKWRCERDAADVAWDDCVRCKTAEAQISI